MYIGNRPFNFTEAVRPSCKVILDNSSVYRVIHTFQTRESNSAVGVIANYQQEIMLQEFSNR